MNGWDSKRQECSVTDGPASDIDAIEDARAPEEREFDKYLDTDPEDYAEPEDNFSLTVRLRMMINHIANHNSFDQRQLIQLLKDAKQMADSHTMLIAKVEDTTDKIRSHLIGKSQA